MPNYKLTYFDLRGRAEPIRLLFVYAGVPFEDVRIKREDWPKRRDEMPYKIMPVLEIDGKKVSQSEAILRYVARELGLAGKTSFDQAIADEFAGAMKDISLTIPWVEKDEEIRNEMMKIAFTEKIPPALELIEKRMNGEYYGNELSYADIFFANIADFLLEKNPQMLDPTPKLKDLHKRVVNLPQIARHIETRPKTAV